MSYPATVFEVMIASPGDVKGERIVARELVVEWNAVHSRSRKIVLQPTGWETHSSPSMDDRPQGIINSQILRHCDLLVAIFWNRLGSPTGEAPSGTVEEIEKHIAAGKPTMIYFSSAPADISTVNKDQYNQLVQFKESLKGRGLIESFQSIDEFRGKFHRQLAAKLNEPWFQPPKASALSDGDFSPSRRRDLTKDAERLLLEASKDPQGRVIYASVLRGKKIETNSRSFVAAGNPREAAKWEQVMDDLVRLRLITRSGENTYKVTADGYATADGLSD